MLDQKILREYRLNAAGAEPPGERGEGMYKEKQQRSHQSQYYRSMATTQDCEIITGYDKLLVMIRMIIRHGHGEPKIMRPSKVFQSHRNAVRELALRHRVRNVRVFGSVLHGDDTDDSDLDLLVDPTSETTLMDIARIQNQLQVLLGVPVDVLTPKALPLSCRERVLREAVPV